MIIARMSTQFQRLLRLFAGLFLQRALDLREISKITRSDISLIRPYHRIIANEWAIEELQYEVIVFILGILERIGNSRSCSDDTDIDTPTTNSHRDAIFIDIDSDEM